MIKSIAQLAFLYVITRTFIELAFPAGRHLLKFIYWSAIILTIIIAVGPQINRVLDDIHNASVTYTKVKDGVNTVTQWPDIKESIPFIGTGPIKQKP